VIPIALACSSEPGPKRTGDRLAGARPVAEPPGTAAARAATPTPADPVPDAMPDDAAAASPDASAAVVAAPEPTSGHWIRGEVVAGDSFIAILGRCGVLSKQSKPLVAAISPHVDPTALRVGHKWGVRVAPDGTLLAFELALSSLRTVRVERDASGNLVAGKAEIETQLEVVAFSVTIDSSLWAAITAAGEDGSIVPTVVEIFASHVDFFTDPRKGDRFAVVVEKHTVDGAFAHYGRVLAARYEGSVGDFSGLWWTAPGAAEGAYYAPDGKNLDRTMLKSPLKYSRVSSGFDLRRMHPVLHRTKAHLGVDYAAPEGTPVWAAADGTIEVRADTGGGGNTVVLAHDGGLHTIYMHLSRFAKGQAVGQRVRQKTVIGYVGRTGLATGAHLHFGVKRNGKLVDPAEVKAAARPGVPKKHRPAFDDATAEARAKLDALALGTP
jgi:hypothetical protein